MIRALMLSTNKTMIYVLAIASLVTVTSQAKTIKHAEASPSGEEATTRWRHQIVVINRTTGGRQLEISLALVCPQCRTHRQLTLRLTRAVGLYAWAETSWRREAESALCQFSGVAAGGLHGLLHSFASLNLCRGPSGIVDTGSEKLTVVPPSASEALNVTYRELVETSLTQLRAIFRQSGGVLLTRMSHQRQQQRGCAVKEPQVPDGHQSGRHRRSLAANDSSTLAETVSQRFVEVLFVVDSSIVEFHRSILDDFVFGILGVAQGVFRDPQLEESVELVLASIYRLTPEDEARIMPGGSEHVASNLLDLFNAWIRRLHHSKFGKSISWDISVLLTRKFLFSYAEYNNQFIKDPVLGITTYRSVCEKRRNGIVLQELGLQSGFSLAHELGHAFDMHHDNSPVCTRKLHPRESQGSFVMDSSLHPSTYPWTWSACSKLHLRNFLQTSQPDCTKERSQPLVLLQHKARRSAESRFYPQFTVDEQCKLQFGSEATLCDTSFKPCGILWCRVPLSSNKSICWSKKVVWAPRTPCGSNLICLEGECVPDSHQAVDGGWSQWSEWTNCSADCGGGVRWRRRFCNSPRPRKGGAFCRGHRALAQSCGLAVCPDGATARDAQCAEFAKRRDPAAQTAVAVFPRLTSASRCRSLTCVTLPLHTPPIVGRARTFTIDRVQDGTACHPFDYGVCIGGVCQAAGCDGVLHSSRLWDDCGVCGGNNDTCHLRQSAFSVEIRADMPYTHTFVYGSNAAELSTEDGTGLQCTLEIVNLSNDTAQSTQSIESSEDAQFPTMLSSSQSTPRLHRSQQPLMQSVHGQRREMLASGAWVVISEPEPAVGRLDWHVRTHGRLTGDLSIRLRHRPTTPSVGVAHKVALRSRVRLPNLRMRVAPVGTCSRSCHGRQTLEHVCEDVGAADGGAPIRLAASDCLSASPPIQIPSLPAPELCNTHCQYNWRVARGNCSSRCGVGSAVDRYDCVLTREGSPDESVEPDATNCDPRPVRLLRRDCQGDCRPVAWRLGPWSACSETCGHSGIQHRVAVCVDPAGGEWPASECRHLPAPERLSKPCEDPISCPAWRVGQWSSCDAYCSRGLQRRSVSCEWNSSEPAPPALCPKGEEPAGERNCTGQCHGTWVAGNWSECLSPCQDGRQLRQLNCVIGRKRVNALNCQPSGRPAYSKDCSQQCVRWLYSHWGPCSVTCGDAGSQERLAFCINATNRVVEKRDCLAWVGQPTDVTRPCHGLVSCATPKSKKIYWRVTDWSNCSSSCGRDGVRHRAIDCVTMETGSNASVTDPAECERTGAPRPSSTEACNRHVDCPYWIFRPWSKCSAVCGAGWKTRHAICVWRLTDVAFVVAPPALCPDASLLREPCVRDEECSRWRAGNWTECLAECDQGIQLRIVHCHQGEQAVDDEACDGRTRPVDIQICNSSVPCSPTWVIGSWGECSQSCGEAPGIQTRAVTCRNGYDEETRGCAEDARPDDSRKCGSVRCPTWVAGDWTACVGICGNGTRTRDLSCQWGNGTAAVTAASCPAVAQAANETCQLDVECVWRVGPWSRCSGFPVAEACAHGAPARQRRHSRGHKHRTVECGVSRSPGEQPLVLPDALCDASRQKPRSRRRCRLGPSDAAPNDRASCGRKSPSRRDVFAAVATQRREMQQLWQVTPWSSCSATCGHGHQIRRALPCNASAASSADAPGCQRRRPREHRRCFLAFCPTDWRAGPWGACTATCGPGIVTRRVTCQRVSPEGWHLGPAADPGVCDPTTVPEAARACNLRDCSVRQLGGVWRVGDFGECRYASHSGCGYGERQRSVRCESGPAGAAGACPADGAPPEREACPPRSCLAASCAELKRLTRVKLDGEYSLVIAGRVVQVYCFGMRGRQPREFLSLAPTAGQTRNYAVMHNIALSPQAAARCPSPARQARFNRAECSLPNKECSLVLDTPSFVTGMSSFRKYRLLLEPKLQIDVADDTFAISWKSFVPAGQAGDCFSRLPNCALGRFSIDLTGTTFAIDSGNEWVGENATTKMIQYMDQHRVQGVCGGSCGFCKLPGHRLQVSIASSLTSVAFDQP